MLPGALWSPLNELSEAWRAKLQPKHVLMFVFVDCWWCLGDAHKRTTCVLLGSRGCGGISASHLVMAHPKQHFRPLTSPPSWSEGTVLKSDAPREPDPNLQL